MAWLLMLLQSDDISLPLLTATQEKWICDSAWDLRCEERGCGVAVDGGQLMHGSDAAVEGDGTVDDGRWRSIALPLLRRGSLSVKGGAVEDDFGDLSPWVSV
uniref:Uncharacterized protein n=1 Tax=Populus alba TaxID=43335 RepID=A0A4U5PRZ8_POPAL|nr:hypothetical protein D5086_0000189420 [Populus alba]